MNKLKLILLAALLSLSITGLALSHELMYDPQTTSGGAYIVMPVYNNAGADLDPGDVVVWDIDASTGDNDFYVTTTTTADTSLVAGVVWPNTIASAAVGTIAIWGIVECDTSSLGIGDSSVLCTSTTAGAGDVCGTTSLEDGNGYAISNVAIGASSQGSCFVR